MKNTRFLITLSLTLGLSGYAAAATVCGNTGVACVDPAGNGSAGSWTASASGMTGIQCLDAGGTDGNAAGSRYFFAAANSDLGATVNRSGIPFPGDGTKVLGIFVPNSGSTPGSTVVGGGVQQLFGGQTYFFYAEACPTGAPVDSANCSPHWVQIGSKLTLPYPTSVFLAPVKPTDATTNSIAARTNVPNADVNNISVIQLEVDNMITSGLNQTGINITWPLANQANIVDSTMYTAGGGFVPNTKYQYKGQVFYPYGVPVPTGGAQTIPGGTAGFWTTPVKPGSVIIVPGSITHCSVQVSVTRSAGTPTNPTYTSYQACVAPGGTPCSGAATIPGTGLPSDSQNYTIAPLLPGTTYQAEALALVGNGDGSSAGWNSSGYALGPSFVTAGIGNATFAMANIATTSADFTFSGLDLSGITGYQMLINGVAFGPQVNTPPVSPIHMTGLTPNTQYVKVQIELIESGSCRPIAPPAGLNFTTDAAVPTAFGLTAPTPNSLNATWTDAVNLPANTAYQVQYCTDSGFTLNCQIFTTGKGVTTATLTGGVNPSTTYFAHVLALSVGGGNNSPYSNSASATTPPNNISMSISPNPATVVAGANQVFTATVTDFQGTVIPGATVQWSLPGGGGSLSGTNPAAQITFTAGVATGTFTIQADRPGYTSVTANITVTAAGQVPTTITVAPSAATVNPGASTVNTFFTATVTDQFGNPISGQPVNWSINGAGNSVSTANGVQTGVKAGGTPGSFTLTASLPGATPGTATINIPSQIFSGVKLCAVGDASCKSSITLQTLQNQQFAATALDQFGNPFLGTITWGWTNNVSAAGASASFSSPSLGTNIRIVATGTDQNNVSHNNFILVNVVSFDVSGAKAFPVPYKANSGTGVIHFSGLGNQWTLHIYTVSGRRVFDLAGSTDTFDWNIKNSAGDSLASGVYFYLVESPMGKKNGKLIIIQ